MKRRSARRVVAKATGRTTIVQTSPAIVKKPKNFILCPTCNSKSKKLRSEMGGLQTRKCQRGHFFEVDTFFGFETNKRRVENIDRPLFVDGSYVDYIQGRYKDDPKGKMDMLKDILKGDERERRGEKRR